MKKKSWILSTLAQIFSKQDSSFEISDGSYSKTEELDSSPKSSINRSEEANNISTAGNNSPMNTVSTDKKRRLL
ncbi:hypothetical protein HQ531_09440 [bacterium]|nr:hypothetical protein [bacterium]